MAIPQVLSSQRCKEWWGNYKITSLDPAFVEFVDDFMKDKPEVNMLEMYEYL